MDNDKKNKKLIRQVQRINEAIINNKSTRRQRELEESKATIVEKLLKTNIGLIYEAQGLIPEKHKDFRDDFDAEFLLLFVVCVDNYRLDSSAKFSSFYLSRCKWALNNIITRIIGGTNQRDNEFRGKDYQYINDYRQKHKGKYPTLEMRAENLGVGPVTFKNYLRVSSQQYVSLNSQARYDSADGSCYEELIEDKRNKEPDYFLIKEEINNKIEAFAESFDYIDREIFYYWIGKSCFQNSNELCKALKISKNKFNKRRKHFWFVARKYFKNDLETIRWLARQSRGEE